MSNAGRVGRNLDYEPISGLTYLFWDIRGQVAELSVFEAKNGPPEPLLLSTPHGDAKRYRHQKGIRSFWDTASSTTVQTFMPIIVTVPEISDYKQKYRDARRDRNIISYKTLHLSDNKDRTIETPQKC